MTWLWLDEMQTNEQSRLAVLRVCLSTVEECILVNICTASCPVISESGPRNVPVLKSSQTDFQFQVQDPHVAVAPSVMK